MSEIQELQSRLNEYSKGCEDRCIDLRTMQFDTADGESKLFNDTETYYFKRDPKNPKDPRVVHAAQQFCKLIGVPFSFFVKNPENMKKALADCWLGSMKAEKATVMAKLRVSPDGNVFRALLPVEYTNIENSDLIEMIANEAGDDFKLEFVIGDERDGLILHTRFISKDGFEACGETCSYGFSVIASELGASPLSVDTMLFRHQSKTCMLATYGGTESFFTCEYAKIQPNDLKTLFPQLISHLKDQLPEIKDCIQAAKELSEKEEDAFEILKDLKMKKGLSDKFHRLIFQEVESNPSMNNRWELANRIALIGQEFEIKKRLKIERVAGELIGLKFAKA